MSMSLTMKKLLGGPHRGVGAGLLLAGSIMLLGLTAPMLAFDQPIVCHYQGQLCFPAMVASLRNLPLIGRAVPLSRPFGLAGFDAKGALDQEAFAIWPPIPFGPFELADSPLKPPSADHLLGTDDRGRDVASRIIHATTVSARVALCAVLLAGVIGTSIGAVAGYSGGYTDLVLSRVIEVFVCFPTFFLLLAVVVWFEPCADYVILLIGLTQWTSIARLMRAECVRLKSRQFILAARGTGISELRLIGRHMLPCALAPLCVAMTFATADAVLIEAGLSWLGFGVAPPQPSWGTMLRDAYDQMRAAPLLLYPPCLMILAAVTAFHLIGSGIRKTFDTRTSQLCEVRV